MRKVTSPYFIFGAISALFILLLSLFLYSFIGLNFLLSLFTALNITTFILYGYDKFSAKNKLLRVPEWNLHIVDMIGGSFAGFLAQKFFRHKTYDSSFRPLYLTIVMIQILLLGTFLTYWYF